MKHGYYWVKRKLKSELEIALLTKNSGWKYFDGSHSKMIPNSPEKIIQRVEMIEVLEE